MVEIKYDESKDHLKLPKNIRQIGRPGDEVKIYVEDYVVTYLNQISRESPKEEALAVLLGDTIADEKSAVVFVNGAVAVRQVNIHEEHIGFTSSVWSDIYDDIKKYFGETKVIGWFLTRPGKSLRITEKIIKLHVDNFPGEGKTLFVADPLDEEETFYIYRKGELVRQDGYYIYYERNEAMQNYMVETKKEETPLDEAMKTVTEAREKIAQHKREIGLKNPVVMRKMTRYASAAVFLLVLGAGVVVVNRENQKVKSAPDYPLESGMPVGVIGGDLGENSFFETENKTVSETCKEVTETELIQDDAKDEMQTEAQCAASLMQPSSIAGTHYTVAGGDTLASISRRFYNTLAYVDEICRINGIVDADKIYPGMRLVLP